MPRAARSYHLETRTSRRRLEVRRPPYWLVLVEGRALGYHKGERNGTWLAKYRSTEGERVQKLLGHADDKLDSNSSDILTFAEAQEAARRWFAERDKLDGKVPVLYTVDHALDDYLAVFSGKSLEKTRHAIETRIRPELGSSVISRLTTARLAKFLADEAARPASYRANRKGERKLRPSGVEGDRSRRASANRVFTCLKAALNLAFKNGKVPDDLAWRRVKPFAKVSSQRIRYFTSDEIKALMKAANPEFGAVLLAALFTGARWSELYLARVRDLDLIAGTILFPVTKSGRARHVHLTEKGVAFFKALCRKKNPDDRLFTNASGKAFGPSHQVRPMRQACERAGIEAAGFHILRHTYGSTLAMAGVPMAVIAEALGHADERITRKHYAHLCPSYVRDTVRNGLGALEAIC